MIDKELKMVEIAALYELRLILTNGEKKEYTLDELTELPDKLAAAKEQE